MSEEMLSQDEIDALLEAVDDEAESRVLTPMQSDSLVELGTLSMTQGTDVLSSLVGRKVSLGTTEVSVVRGGELERGLEGESLLLASFTFEQGPVGKSVFVAAEGFGRSLVGLMLTGSTELDESMGEEELLDAFGELINQLLGAVSTGLSEAMGTRVTYSLPEPARVTEGPAARIREEMGGSEPLVRLDYTLNLVDELEGRLTQFLTVEGAVSMAEPVVGKVASKDSPGTQLYGTTEGLEEKVEVQPAEFQDFGRRQTPGQQKNIEMLLDVPLELTVELGRTQKSIREILALGPGSIIELDKLAGEAVDVLVNGKLIAHGEVVVIDESFGVRITSIQSPRDRVSSLK